MVVLRPLFAAALVVCRRNLIVAAQAVSRGAARCASQVNNRGAHADAEAPRMYLIVVYRPFPAAPFVVRCMYMAVVPRPMPAALVSRCCRRRLQQLVCACGSYCKTDACGRSFAVLSTQVSTVGLRLRLVVP